MHRLFRCRYWLAYSSQNIDGRFINLQVTWSKYEVSVESMGDVTVAQNPPPPPTLSVLSLKVLLLSCSLFITHYLLVAGDDCS